MDIEKVEKLIMANSFEDVYLGLSLFDKLGRGDRLKILRKNFEYKNNSTYTWYLIKEWDISEDNNGKYIKGKNYAYSIDSMSVMIDSKAVFNRYIRRKHEPFKVIETWE